MSNTNKLDWGDIEFIWNRWTNFSVPVTIQEKCKQEFKPSADSLQIIVEKNIEYGNIVLGESESYEMGQKMANAINQATRASFMVGLEYGHKDQLSPRTHDFVKNQAELALPYIEVAGEPVKILASQLINMFIHSKQFDKSEAEHLAKMFGDSLLTSLIRCFRIGLEYSANI
jgi:hypothetical protein